ncbi:MAG: hypothetical protein I8H71_00360 [Xanthomonadaceae bacterium]|nr:hypothetical protein [Xanthomonadaceae bacterium]MBH2008125.1 hypothetical protein [Xanthomonadaceae bacterium]
MFNITNTGSISQMIREVRDIPARVIPYAASTALTRTAQLAAKDALPGAMRRAFDRPTPYAINSLFVKPATAQTLSARVMVKNTATRGVVPENFLQPGVEGGGRREKGIEKALRYSGLLKTGFRVMPGGAQKLDAFGNVSGASIRSLLSILGQLNGVGAGRKDVVGGRVKNKGSKLKNDLFVGIPSGGNRPDGIWRRERGKLRPLFIFTNKAPKYTARFDFTGVVQGVAEKQFSTIFAAEVEKMISKGIA